MRIDEKIIIVGCGCTPSSAKIWLKPLIAAMDRYEINTPRRVAAFLANVGVETGGLVSLVENLNYSAQGLADTWPNRYAVDQRATPKVPNAKAVALARKPQAIANETYANRMGNGSVASGDGWKFRGQGPIQTTGKDNIMAVGKALGINIVDDPSKLQEPGVGSMAAAYYFKTRGCNVAADAGNIEKVITQINGRAPSKANHGPLRIQRYKDCLAAITA